MAVPTPSAAAPAFAPTEAGQRLAALDALRGLALLGIALSNAALFTAPLTPLAEGIDPSLRGADRWAEFFLYAFVSDKFWTLFSLLFGMGFALMLQRAGTGTGTGAGAAQAPGFGRLYLRRSLGLLAIGLAHAWLVWSGDILTTYAVAAFALLALRRLSAAAMLRLGLALYLGVVAFFVLIAALLALPGVAQADPAVIAAAERSHRLEAAVYAHGGYWQASAYRLGFFFEETVAGWPYLLPSVLGLFLIGASLLRSGAIAEPARHRGRLRAWSGYGLAASAALTALSLWVDSAPSNVRFSSASVLAQTLHLAAGLPFALALMAWVVLALQRGAGWPRLFAPAGRMALSHYLAQSLIGTWVFYGYGLGLWQRWGPAHLAAAALAVFAMQLLVSRWWLRRYRFGPAEWCWRALTYGRLPPWRAAGAPAASPGAG